MSRPAWIDGTEQAAPESFALPGAVALLKFLSIDGSGAATLVETRRGLINAEEIVIVLVPVDRPQDRAVAIRREEELAIVFRSDDYPPIILAMCADFPVTPHQNPGRLGDPASLCVDDRPWSEAKVSWSAADLVRRIRTWLERAVRGELVDLAQPPEPLFVRTGHIMILATEALEARAPIELFGYSKGSNAKGRLVLMTAPIGDQPDETQSRFTVLVLQAPPQPPLRLRHVPQTLKELVELLSPMHVDLLATLYDRLRAWAGTDKHKKLKLASLLAIAVSFPIVDPATGTQIGTDRRAFCMAISVGELGVTLGWLDKGRPGAGGTGSYLPILGPTTNADAAGSVPIDVLEIHVPFDRRMASDISGRTSVDERHIVIIGGGAIGSQLATNLTREGTFRWTVVDEDVLLPHNLARHALPFAAVGLSKAAAMAIHLNHLIDSRDNARSIETDILHPGDKSDDLDEAMKSADLIVDASASVAVSRHLSDLQSPSARRFAVFFNPAGTAVVLLAEDQERTIKLRDLEAQYYGLICREPALTGHLYANLPALRYSGSCRALTNRIPQSKVAILSGIIAGALSATLDNPASRITVWSLSDTFEVRAVSVEADPIDRSLRLSDWTVSIDAGALARIDALRARMLPAETGGILVGVVDRVVRSIHIAEALPPPPDSAGTDQGFERGVQGIADDLTRIERESMGYLRYVGEWHSHPPSASALPSRTDVDQLTWLRNHLVADDLPALMLIAADRDVTITTYG